MRVTIKELAKGLGYAVNVWSGKGRKTTAGTHRTKSAARKLQASIRRDISGLRQRSRAHARRRR